MSCLQRDEKNNEKVITAEVGICNNAVAAVDQKMKSFQTLVRVGLSSLRNNSLCCRQVADSSKATTESVADGEAEDAAELNRIMELEDEANKARADTAVAEF